MSAPYIGAGTACGDPGSALRYGRDDAEVFWSRVSEPLRPDAPVPRGHVVFRPEPSRPARQAGSLPCTVPWVPSVVTRPGVSFVSLSASW